MKQCLRCGAAIPSKTIIDGKVHWTHKRKYCIACSPIGIHNTRPIKEEIETGLSFCLLCKLKLPLSSFFIKKSGRPFSYCKECLRIVTSGKARANKIMSVEYKGGKCMDCGYDKCIDALEFHHRDPSVKDKLSMSRSFNRIKEELDKCDLLCANCHRERHHRERNDK